MTLDSGHSNGQVEVKGTVLVRFTVEHRVAPSIATEGWTDAEKKALLDGDEEAREELATAVWHNGQALGFDDVEDDMIDMRVSQ
jgi:hypothetical protein